MARTKTPPPAPSGLHRFEGREVIGTRVAVTNAGDGLSTALAVDPEELGLGATVYVVLQCEVTKIRFEPVPDTEALTRVHTLRAGVATTVDHTLVKDVLDLQTKKIEASKGIQHLPLDETDDDWEGA